MDYFPGTFADVLATLNSYYLASLTDAEVARRWSRDHRTQTRGVAKVLDGLGGQVWWQDRNPAGSCDDTPFIRASLDPTTGLLRFDAATLDQVRTLPNAGNYSADGEPMEIPGGR